MTIVIRLIAAVVGGGLGLLLLVPYVMYGGESAAVLIGIPVGCALLSAVGGDRALRLLLRLVGAVG